MLVSVNEWIVANKELVILVVLPLLTLAVTQVVSRANSKASLQAQRQHRILQKEIKLAEFRQAWIHQLRDALAAYMAKCTREEEKSADLEGIALALVKVRLLMNVNDPDYDELMDAMVDNLDSLAKETPEKAKSENVNLGTISQKILKREWDRLRDDLDKIDIAESEELRNI